MKHLKKALLAVLLAAALLCGCAKTAPVRNAEDAVETLETFLNDFVYSENEDAYHCTLLETLKEDGGTVYRFEAFWDADGEAYSLGQFCVSEDGTVTLDPAE